MDQSTYGQKGVKSNYSHTVLVVVGHSTLNPNLTGHFMLSIYNLWFCIHTIYNNMYVQTVFDACFVFCLYLCLI